MWLKRLTPQNIVIGGAAGAFPPVIGWVIATGTMSIEPWLMFALIFMWTPPHFWALGLVHEVGLRRRRRADADRDAWPQIARGIAYHCLHCAGWPLLAIGTGFTALVGQSIWRRCRGAECVVPERGRMTSGAVTEAQAEADNYKVEKSSSGCRCGICSCTFRAPSWSRRCCPLWGIWAGHECIHEHEIHKRRKGPQRGRWPDAGGLCRADPWLTFVKITGGDFELPTRSRRQN